MLDKNILHLAIARPEEVWRDLRRNFPWLVCLAVFLFIYVLVSAFLASKLEKWTYLHAAYFTAINTTTVGFGDVVPATHLGKLLAGTNALVGLVIFGVFISVLTMALQPSSYSGTIDIPKPEGIIPEEKRRNDNEAPINDFFRGLNGLFKVIENPPYDNQSDRRCSGRATIHVHCFDPHHVIINIDLDLKD